MQKYSSTALYKVVCMLTSQFFFYFKIFNWSKKLKVTQSIIILQCMFLSKSQNFLWVKRTPKLILCFAISQIPTLSTRS